MDLFSREYIENARKMRKTFFKTGDASLVTGVRPEIVRNWESSYQYCLRTGFADPTRQKDGRLTAEQFREALERATDLISVAEPYMRLLHSFLDSDSFWVTLMDAQGAILKVIGSEKMLEVARFTKVDEGASRSKETPYPGLFNTCLLLDKPYQMVATEHAADIDDDIAGAGCPIHDSNTGECLGVIAVSGYWWKSHDHTLGLTIMTSEAISRQLALLQKSRDIAQASQKLNEALEVADFGLIYFHRDGTIHAANQRAIHMLSPNPIPREEVLKNHNIFEFFSQTFSPAVMDDIDRKIELSGKFADDLVPAQKYQPVHCTIRHVSEQPNEYVMQLQKASDLTKIATDRAILQPPFTFTDIIGNSTRITAAIDAAHIASNHTTSLLITGESGTGKELFAQAIHNASDRAKEPFVAINCGAIPRSLIESELFGYESGAFTGAQKGGRMGKFELANKGTLFLDEIGDMPYEIQIMLLRVLQTKEVVRIGGKTPIKVDVRIIAATNQPLEERIRENTFRQDLYYRLNVLNIHLPSLRDRPCDISLLSNYFLQKYSRAFDKRISGISPEALSAMEQYHWPGNIRQLENAIERATIICSDSILQLTDLPEAIRSSVIPQPLPATQKTESTVPPPQPMSSPEAEELRRSLQICNGNISDVAKMLGVSRPTVYRKLKKYGFISQNRFDI